VAEFRGSFVEVYIIEHRTPFRASFNCRQRPCRSRRECGIPPIHLFAAVIPASIRLICTADGDKHTVMVSTARGQVMRMRHACGNLKFTICVAPLDCPHVITTGRTIHLWHLLHLRNLAPSFAGCTQRSAIGR
jgi:hypothetical protein